jgi:hypothetical protein
MGRSYQMRVILSRRFWHKVKNIMTDYDKWAAVRLLLVLSENIGSLFDLLQESVQGSPNTKSFPDTVHQPNKGADSKQPKHCFPDWSFKPEGIVKGASHQASNECNKQGDGRNPTPLGSDTPHVLSKAQFEFVPSDNDNLLFKVKMNRRWLDKLRAEGLGELRFWRTGKVAHCALFSGAGAEIVASTFFEGSFSKSPSVPKA